MKIHGGPTAAASTAFSLGIQFWTSRGVPMVHEANNFALPAVAKELLAVPACFRSLALGQALMSRHTWCLTLGNCL